jgi:hypothetical protein
MDLKSIVGALTKGLQMSLNNVVAPALGTMRFLEQALDSCESVTTRRAIREALLSCQKDFYAIVDNWVEPDGPPTPELPRLGDSPETKAKKRFRSKTP